MSSTLSRSWSSPADEYLSLPGRVHFRFLAHPVPAPGRGCDLPKKSKYTSETMIPQKGVKRKASGIPYLTACWDCARIIPTVY